MVNTCSLRVQKGLYIKNSLAIGHESLDRLGILSMSKDKKRVSSHEVHPFRIEWLPEKGENGQWEERLEMHQQKTHLPEVALGSR